MDSADMMKLRNHLRKNEEAMTKPMSDEQTELEKQTWEQVQISRASKEKPMSVEEARADLIQLIMDGCFDSDDLDALIAMVREEDAHTAEMQDSGPGDKIDESFNRAVHICAAAIRGRK